MNAMSKLLELIGIDQRIADLPSFSETLDILFETLTEREKIVLRLRFGLVDDETPRTLSEIGGMFNVTKGRVRQIEAKAIRKMRHPTRINELIKLAL